VFGDPEAGLGGRKSELQKKPGNLKETFHLREKYRPQVGGSRVGRQYFHVWKTGGHHIRKITTWGLTASFRGQREGIHRRMISSGESRG